MAKDVISDYSSIWKVISPELVGHLPMSAMRDRLLLYIPGTVGKLEYDFLIGYEFEFEYKIFSAFFGFNGKKLEYIHVDSMH